MKTHKNIMCFAQNKKHWNSGLFDTRQNMVFYQTYERSELVSDCRLQLQHCHALKARYLTRGFSIVFTIEATKIGCAPARKRGN